MSDLTPKYVQSQIWQVILIKAIVVNSIENMNVIAGEQIVFRPTVTSNHDYEDLLYSLSSNQPYLQGTVDNTGIVEISTTKCSSGTITFNLTITDEYGQSATTMIFTVTVDSSSVNPDLFIQNPNCPTSVSGLNTPCNYEAITYLVPNSFYLSNTQFVAIDYSGSKITTANFQIINLVSSNIYLNMVYADTTTNMVTECGFQPVSQYIFRLQWTNIPITTSTGNFAIQLSVASKNKVVQPFMFYSLNTVPNVFQNDLGLVAYDSMCPKTVTLGTYWKCQVGVNKTQATNTYIYVLSVLNGLDSLGNPQTNSTCNYTQYGVPYSASPPNPTNAIIQYGDSYFEWLVMEKGCT